MTRAVQNPNTSKYSSGLTAKLILMTAVLAVTVLGIQDAQAQRAVRCRGYRNWNGGAAPAGKPGGYIKYQKVMEVCHTSYTYNDYEGTYESPVRNCKTAGIIDGYYTTYWIVMNYLG